MLNVQELIENHESPGERCLEEILMPRTATDAPVCCGWRFLYCVLYLARRNVPDQLGEADGVAGPLETLGWH